MRAALWPVGLALGVGCQSEAEWTIASADLAVTVSAEPFHWTVSNARGETILESADGDGAYGALVSTHDDPVYEDQLVPGWDRYRPGESAWLKPPRGELTETRGDRVTVRFADEGSVEFRVRTGRLRMIVRAPERVAVTPGGAFTKTSMAFRLPDDEHFFGLGERMATVDHRGWSLYSWAEEGGLGKGENAEPAADNPFPNGPSMTNFPVPFVHSNKGYALYLDTTYRNEFHLGSEDDDRWRIAANTTDFALTVYVDDRPLANIDRYTEDTGRPIMPAPWVFGPRRRSSHRSSVDGQPEYIALRERGVPTTGLDDAVHFLPDLSHVGREEILRQWTEDAHRLGYKVMAYNNPYVSLSKEEAADDREFGVQNDLFVKDAFFRTGEVWFISGELQTLATIDLTLEEGTEWFKSLMRRTLDLGYDGWMHDFGEYVLPGWRAGNGMLGEELHNLFPVLSAKAAHELMEDERPGDYLFFVRSGYTGTQQYVPAVWSGDPEASFDSTQGIPATLSAGLNLSMAGVPYWGSDISGFKCYGTEPRDKEVYLRWAQLGAVSPIMMSQSACAYLTGRQEKWNLWNDEETVEVYARMARLHTRLQPYFLMLAKEATETGAPLMRHNFLVHPKEREALREHQAFYLGHALYAAPVVARGQTEKTFWLPPGLYLDWDDYRTYDGNRTITVDAPLQRLPLFLVAQQLVPLLDRTIETLGEADDPSVVTPRRVSDRLDVVGLLLPGSTATATLVDGTELTVTLEEDAGNPDGLVEAQPADLDDCAACFRIDSPGTVTRYRVNSPLRPSASIRFGPLTLEHRGGPARRIRWEILTRP